jgi:hypothetical protein
MKKLIFFLSILVFAACTEQEVVKSNATASAGKDASAVGREKTLSCEAKVWYNQVYGMPGSNPYGTNITTHLSHYAGTGINVQGYHIDVKFKNNSTNTLNLYKDNALVGSIAANGTRTYTFYNSPWNCLGTNLIDIYYTWTVTRTAGSGSTQVIMTTFADLPHTIASGGGGATLIFY